MLARFEVGVKKPSIVQSSNHAFCRMHIETNCTAFKNFCPVKHDQGFIRVGLWNLSWN